MDTISRRGFFKGAAAGIAGAAAGAAGIALAEEPQGLVPGSYTATVPGYRGEETVSVTFDETSITDVTIHSTDYPPHMADRVAKEMESRIMAAQSWDVDIVSGATFTSLGIINAVETCAQQAGGAELFATPVPAAESPAPEDVECDVLVIGSGLAGCVAALTAKTEHLDGVDSGLSVIMIEKQDVMGGTSMLAMGNFRICYPMHGTPSREQIDAGIAQFTAKNILPVNTELAENMLPLGGDTISRLQAMGIGFNSLGGDADVQDNWFKIGPYIGRMFFPYAWAAHTYYSVLEDLVPNTGIDLRLSTAMTELVVEDGAVVGALVESPAGAYTIRAKKVVLACGGIGQNQELMEQYAPHGLQSTPYCGGGSDGDGFREGLKLGAQVLSNPEDGLIGSFCYNANYGCGADFMLSTPYFLVNNNGERFIAENGNTHTVAVTITSQPDAEAFIVIDSDNPNAAKFASSLFLGDIIQCADTLEELAELSGIDAAGLTATIDACNEAIDANAEDALGLPDDKRVPVRTAPFYALRVGVCHLGTMVGMKVDGSCRILDSNDSPIPNLFGAGELVYGGNLATSHVDGGAITTCFHTGRVVGDAVKTELLS